MDEQKIRIRPELVQVIPSDDFLWQELGAAAAPATKDDEPDMEPGVAPPDAPQGIALHAGETVTISRYLPAVVLRRFMDYYEARNSAASGVQVFQLIADVCVPLSQQILAWTWTDPLTGQPLPQPYGHPDVLEALDVPHISYLINLVVGGTTKNASPTSKP
jgi:hypothetical protein